MAGRTVKNSPSVDGGDLNLGPPAQAFNLYMNTDNSRVLIISYADPDREKPLGYISMSIEDARDMAATILSAGVTQ